MKESRLFRILYYLLEKGRTSAPELAKQFEVSVRTIYRDVDVISSAGVPIFVTPGRYGGIELYDNYVINKAVFNDKEKQDLLAILQSVATIDNTYEEHMLTKLSALFNVHYDNWFEIDFSSWGHTSRDNTIFESTKYALINHRVTTITYANSNGFTKKRNIYPIKMLYKYKSWYLKAYCVTRQDYRIFKINRIIHIEILDETFTPMEYPLAQEEDTSTYIKVVLQFNKQLAYRVYDEFSEDEIQYLNNGDLRISSSIPPGDWLLSYILSFGSGVRIIEPLSLQEDLIKAINKISNNYQP